MKPEIRLHALALFQTQEPIRGAFHQAFCQCFSLTTVISYWNPCIWLAESKFVSKKHWQNAWWNAPLDPVSQRVTINRTIDINRSSMVNRVLRTLAINCKPLWKRGPNGRKKLLKGPINNANACWLVLIYDTLIITYVAKRISKYVSYIL